MSSPIAMCWYRCLPADAHRKTAVGDPFGQVLKRHSTLLGQPDLDRVFTSELADLNVSDVGVGERDLVAKHKDQRTG